MKNITIGDIVFWALLRAAVVIPAVWFSQPYLSYSLWWTAGAVAIYAIVIHPVVIQYQMYQENNKPVFEGTLCSTCRHFDRSAVLCMKYDEHPTETFLPCEGTEWEPKPVDGSDTD